MRSDQRWTYRTARLFLPVALFTTLALSNAWAQSTKGRTNTNTAAAVLHIQVNVIPIVFTPGATPPRQAEAISYIIPTVSRQDQIIVGESWMTSPQACTTQSCNALLRTSTIVAH
jgi:hypothetical protein